MSHNVLKDIRIISDLRCEGWGLDDIGAKSIVQVFAKRPHFNRVLKITIRGGNNLALEVAYSSLPDPLKLSILEDSK